MTKLFKQIVGFGIIGLICFTQGILAQQALFTETGSVDLAKMNSAQQHYLNVLKAEPTTERYQIVEISHVNHLLNQPSVKLNVFPGIQFDFNKVKMESFKDGATAWHGKYPTGDAIIIIRKGNLTGNIRVNGQLYQVKPLSGGLHAIVQFDVAALPPEHGEDYPEGVEDNSAKVEEMLKDASLQPNLMPQASNIDVLVAYSNQAASANPDMVGIIQLAISETNSSYSSSNIPISVSLAHAVHANYNETGNLREDATNLMNGRVGNVHALRDQYGADVCVIISQSGSYCGIAKAIMASAGSAFCAVKTSCATGYYSFGHEIGHLQGARHNIEQDPTLGDPYDFGHGYAYPSGGWRTVMSYNLNGCCTRIPYWSNPNVSRSGVPMGNTSRAHNARVLKLTVNTVSGFRPPYFAANPFVKQDKGLQALSNNFTLHQNYPNPFNPSTTIRYTLKKNAQVSLIIYDAAGKEVRKLLNGTQNAGTQSIVWDGKNDAGQSVASGSYFYHIITDDFKAVKKMQLLK